MPPLILIVLMGSFARTLFSRTLPSRPILCHSGQILHRTPRLVEHFWVPVLGASGSNKLARTNFWSVLCGIPTKTGGFVKGWFVLANVPSFRFSFRGNMRTYPRSGFSFRGNIRTYPRSGFRSGETSAKTTLLETTLLSTPEG